MTAKVPEALDAITDRVLSYRPVKSGSPPSEGPQVEAWSASIASILEDDGLRLDAAYFNPEVEKLLAAIDEAGMRAETLGSITSRVFIPPRFARVYVEADHGVPFLQGSHVVHLEPANLKFLSREAHKNLDRWIIRAGWLLVTCSGTIGNVTICPPEWDNWAASQHILRVVPDEEMCPSGYLCSFLASPLGQVQLMAKIYGGVVDEITEEQASSVKVPIPTTDEGWEWVRSIDATMKESVAERSKAVNLSSKAVGLFMESWPSL